MNLDTSNVDKIIAIGDIHGMYDQMNELLQKIDKEYGDQHYALILLGDYVDRGPESCRVMKHLKMLKEESPENVFLLIGNHEVLMDNGTHKSDQYLWMMNGGKATWNSYEAEYDHLHIHATVEAIDADSDWLRNNAHSLIITDHHMFVHGGPRLGVPLDEQQIHEGVILWNRYWEDDYEHPDQYLGRHVVYGHTPRREPKLLKNSSGLDTGCFAYGTLTAGVFDPRTPSGPERLLQVTGNPAPDWREIKF